jgi:hypothetical protein
MRQTHRGQAVAGRLTLLVFLTLVVVALAAAVVVERVAAVQA